jgi:AcrR family transcriptional regulator
MQRKGRTSLMTGIRKRRSRNPVATREAILDAARTILAKDGAEALSLTEVARRAGVNRGTAYQHFETREKLVDATIQSVSDIMFREVFGDPETIGERDVAQVDMVDVTERLAAFAMANPELGRIWLLQILASPDPSADPFWREYAGSIGRFSQTDMAQDNIDIEVWSVISLAANFIWPVWAQSHAQSTAERNALARRFAREMLRLSMYGTLRSEKVPQVAAMLSGRNPPPPPRLRTGKLRAVK